MPVVASDRTTGWLVRAYAMEDPAGRTAHVMFSSPGAGPGAGADDFVAVEVDPTRPIVARRLPDGTVVGVVSDPAIATVRMAGLTVDAVVDDRAGLLPYRVFAIPPLAGKPTTLTALGPGSAVVIEVDLPAG
jgi:hypothetical protein